MTKDDEKISKIVGKWLRQERFIRFIDGDTHNVAVTNLGYVYLEDALENIDTWVVYWGLHLTQDEIRYVRENVAKIFDYLYRKHPDHKKDQGAE